MKALQIPAEAHDGKKPSMRVIDTVLAFNNFFELLLWVLASAELELGIRCHCKSISAYLALIVASLN